MSGGDGESARGSGRPARELLGDRTELASIECFDEAHSADEDRWLRIGSSLRGALLVVWSTERSRETRAMIRIIGARRANRRERGLYEQEQEDQDG